MATIVQNKEKAYGYNYTSLASLAAAGIEIPKMRTALIDGRQFVEYLDGDEWLQGAEIVVPDMKGMNAAQAYGSALTYARRYTVMMAMSVACTDDQLLEATAPKADKIETPEKTAPKRETRKTAEIPPEKRMEPVKEEAPATPTDTVDMMFCADCGKPIEKHGKYGIMEIAQRTLAGHGRPLCWDCATKASIERGKETRANA